MTNKDKPVIRFWGNGDVHGSCAMAYRKCYPNGIAAFRTEWMPYIRRDYKLIGKITVGKC